MQMPSWDVVATVDEPAALIVAFAAHHLALGASAVHLFLDRPNPQAQAALSRIAAVYVTVCDDAFWARMGAARRPKLHVWRQRKNAERMFNQCHSDWLIAIDCDEYLTDGAALMADLADQPDAVDFMRIPVAERVLMPDAVQTGLFDGIFRRPIHLYGEIGANIYGADAGFYKRGVTGHTIGKSAFRIGRDLQIGIHGPVRKIEGRSDYMPIEGTAAQTELLHFDGMTDLHFALKLLRRAREPVTQASARHGAPRIAQFTAVADIAQNTPAVMDLVRRLKRLTPPQFAALSTTEYLRQAPFDPAGAVVALGLTADLSCAHFDADLRRRDARLIAAAGLAL